MRPGRQKPTFASSYGPWALVAGASEGVGSMLAEALAERGVNVVLLARRQAVLDDVASGISMRTGVQTRTLPVDLAEPGAASAVAAYVADLEIGFLAYCAGADPAYQRFLDQPVEAAEAMVRRNCTVLMQMCHHFARPMVDRGRGGIVILGSGAGLVGAPNIAAYAGSKAFDMVFTEALWAELRPHGVDVLGLVLGETDTPALRRLKHKMGVAGADQPVRGATPVSQVIDVAFANLAKGPSRMVGRQSRVGERMLSVLPRNLAVRMVTRVSARVMSAGRPGGTTA